MPTPLPEPSPEEAPAAPGMPAPPAGRSEPVFEKPPSPAATEPVPPAPPAVLPEPRPEGFQFTASDARKAQAHADRLRAAPGDASLGGYPRDLVQRAAAEVALQPGQRPAVVLFFDDTARSSNLQAAELLSLLVRVRERIDVIPIDVVNTGTWTPAERKLVRTYYMSYVPTTVVLSANRKPLLLQYQRVAAAVVEAALDAPAR